MLRKFILTFGILILTGALSTAQILEKDIVAQGTAAGGSLQSRDSAINRALRNAVEQAVGSIIDSETLVENFQLLDDRIYSEVKGYVRSYDIISDNKGEGGVYTVTIKAVVALGMLEKDVKGLGIIREKMNYPRVMVLMNDYIDGLESPNHIIGTAIEGIFIENKFPVVSKDQTEMIKQRDVTLSYSDPQKAAALGRRYGAEVVIIGQGTASLVDTSTPYGVSVFAYEARAEAKAVKTDNAQVLAVDTTTRTARANGRTPAANKALTDAAGVISDSFLKKLAEAWRNEVYNEASIQLICENADVATAASFKKMLESKRDVKGVNERSLVNGILELDVRFFGSIDQLVTILSEQEEVPVRITGKTPDRIDLKFTE